MLRIYGVPNSQPVRAVVWTCLMKKLPFEFVMTSQNRAAKTPQYLAEVNPRGTIPAIDDDTLVLWESHAILIYLCEKHGWNDLWPDDLYKRAQVNQYLHFHHRNTRELVVHWSRRLWPSVFGVSNPDASWLRRNTFAGMENNQEIVSQCLTIINGMLGENAYLAGDGLTIADISAYEELGQNQPKYANCTSFEPYPHIERWLLAMEQVPAHNVAHAVWRLIGDVNKVEGGMQKIADANKQAARQIQEESARQGIAGRT
ncbi:MAG: glutathione S-transferase family protein [Proteobacteria bacterium]|nr:glutathione S-transferase family protein [Pseudomonadota bacterium]